MKFAIVTAFCPVEEIAPIAQAADQLGYDSLSIADHIVDLDEITTPYPYTEDGQRRWTQGAHWPDPWVMFGALGAMTQRLRFFTSIYVPAIRSPYQVAKAVGTAAIMTGGRVSLGVGVGWSRDEFELMGQDFATRGARTDEALELMQTLWQPGWTSTDGPHYPTPRLLMEPTPPPIPILIGGLSPVALRRAARHDGWVGDISTTDEAIDTAAQLRQYRAAAGRDGTGEVIAALNDAILPQDFERAHTGGVTTAMVAPWAYYFGMKAPLPQKLEAMQRFYDDVVSHFGPE